jgi:hypothetical protein
MIAFVIACCFRSACPLPRPTRWERNEVFGCPDVPTEIAMAREAPDMGAHINDHAEFLRRLPPTVNILRAAYEWQLRATGAVDRASCEAAQMRPS